MAHVASIRCRGFKSVGASWLDVRLGPGLNAIVGPNGCGKSSLLEAILFAFAAPMQLAGLANSDSNEVCEVCVQLQRGQGASRQTHTVQAALTSDGSRAYKVDGRARSGKEVRQFLRGLGICLDSCAAVIKQARVTALADSASPADLAAVVAEASGLGRWNEEVAAACEELKRTRKALAEVEANLKAMEEAVAADGEKLRALERLNQLEHDAAALAQQMAGMLQSALALCDSQAAEQQAMAAAAAGTVADARQAVERRQVEAQAAQQRMAELQQQGGDGCLGGKGRASEQLLQLQETVAVAEEELQLLTQEQDRRREMAQQLKQASAEVAHLKASHTRAAAEVAACQQAQRRVAADLERASSAAAVEGLKASLAAEAGQLSAAVSAKAQEAAAAAVKVESAAARLAEVQAEHMQLSAAARAAEASLAAYGEDPQQLLAKLQAEARLQEGRRLQLQQDEERCQTEVGTLAARLAGTTRTATAAATGSGAAWRPLHRCFTFADPQRCQQYATALQVLAGGKLGVVVADSLEAAGQLLAAGGGARIWPLDTLCAQDHTRQQRQAAASFPEGQVVLPADLLSFQEQYRPSILRAFGSHVIAAGDEVAEQLITRYGIPSVTLDGKLTSRGTLQGGWRGDAASSRQTPMHLKICLAAAEKQLAAVQRAAAEVQAALAAGRQQLAALQQLLDAAETAAAEAAAAEQEDAECQQVVRTQKAALAEAESALRRLRAELAAKQQLLVNLKAADTDAAANSSSEAAKEALMVEQRRLEEAAAGLEERSTQVAAELAAAQARLAAAEDELALCPQDDISRDDQLEILRSKLAAATSALAAKQAELAAQSAALQELQRQAQQAAAGLAAAEQDLAAAEAAAGEQQAAAEQLAAVRADVQRQLTGLFKEVPELAGAGGGSTDDANNTGSSPQTVDAIQKACTKLARQRTKLLAEQQRSAAAGMSLSEQLRFREQQARLAAAKQQAATLETAARRLQEGIDGAGGQVIAVNEAVFAAIAATFKSLIQALLPAYRVRLCKVGSQVHEGVQLEFAHASSSAEPDCDDERGTPSCDGTNWRSGLEVLSGGQRTLVSLTFVVAAAMSGVCTSLLLMDEVDAALDESNQALVARLLDALSSSSSGSRAGTSNGGGSRADSYTSMAGRQVLCVSHNAAFQQLCQHVIRLTKGPEGTQLADGGKAESAAQKSAAVGTGKRVRKQ